LSLYPSEDAQDETDSRGSQWKFEDCVKTIERQGKGASLDEYQNRRTQWKFKLSGKTIEKARKARNQTGTAKTVTGRLS